MKQYYFKFKKQNYTEHCVFLNPYTQNPVQNIQKYIKLGKFYKEHSNPRDSDSKFYLKHLPYYSVSSVLEVESGKLIMIYYELDDFWDNEEKTTLSFDENGFVELEEIPMKKPSKRDWIEVINLDIEKNRNFILNQILEIEEVERELTIQDILDGNFSIDLN